MWQSQIIGIAKVCIHVQSGHSIVQRPLPSSNVTLGIESIAVRKDPLKISQFQAVAIAISTLRTLSNCVVYFYGGALRTLPSTSNNSDQYVCI